MENPEKELARVLQSCNDASRCAEVDNAISKFFAFDSNWQGVNFIAPYRGAIQALHDVICKYFPAAMVKVHSVNMDSHDQTVTIRYTKFIGPITVPLIGRWSSGAIRALLQVASSHLHSIIPATRKVSIPREFAQDPSQCVSIRSVTVYHLQKESSSVTSLVTGQPSKQSSERPRFVVTDQVDYEHRNPIVPFLVMSMLEMIDVFMFGIWFHLAQFVLMKVSGKSVNQVVVMVPGLSTARDMVYTAVASKSSDADLRIPWNSAADQALRMMLVMGMTKLATTMGS